MKRMFFPVLVGLLLAGCAATGPRDEDIAADDVDNVYSDPVYRRPGVNVGIGIGSWGGGLGGGVGVGLGF